MKTPPRSPRDHMSSRDVTPNMAAHGMDETWRFFFYTFIYAVFETPRPQERPKRVCDICCVHVSKTGAPGCDRPGARGCAVQKVPSVPQFIPWSGSIFRFRLSVDFPNVVACEQPPKTTTINNHGWLDLKINAWLLFCIQWHILKFPFYFYTTRLTCRYRFFSTHTDRQQRSIMLNWPSPSRALNPTPRCQYCRRTGARREAWAAPTGPPMGPWSKGRFTRRPTRRPESKVIVKGTHPGPTLMWMAGGCFLG